MPSGRMILATVATLLVAAPPAVGAPGRLLDKSGDKGFPSVFVTGGQHETRTMIVRVTATPNRKVEVRWDISCSLNGKGRFRIGEFTMDGKGKRKLKLTYGRPDECIANVLVGYDDGDEGSIKVELFGRGGATESSTK